MQNTLKEQEVYINKIKNNVEDSEVKTALKLEDLDVISQPIGDSVVDLKSSRDFLLRKVNDMEKSQNSISQSIEDLDNKASDLQSTHSNLKLSTDIDRKQNDVSTEELKTKVNHIDIKLDSITSQVQNMVQHMTHLKCKNDPVFVSAYGFRPNEKFDVQRDEIVRCDTNVVCSARENFDVKTGIFTAPVDGLYLCCAFIDRFSDGGVLFNINMTHSNGNEDTVGGLFSAKHCRHGSTAVPVLMNKNDQLYLKSQDNYKGLDCSLQFVCILIN
ncbi:hypothetical protein Btru_069136 [Bulinus truncatus]|nr:hypothetical protein Btru_069136 [Bulinus truncatus]